MSEEVIVNRKIGIFGGTFDPIHNGHLMIAHYAKERFDLERILFIPSGDPPHKRYNGVTQKEHRFQMIKLAIKSEENFEISRIELIREGYTYTVDTLLTLKEVYPENELYFIIGADIVGELITWKEPKQLFSLCEFIVFFRPGNDLTDYLSTIEFLKVAYGSKIHTCDAPSCDVSSTLIRENVSKGLSIHNYLPREVEQYINQYRLYKRIYIKG